MQRKELVGFLFFDVEDRHYRNDRFLTAKVIKLHGTLRTEWIADDHCGSSSFFSLLICFFSSSFFSIVFRLVDTNASGWQV